MDHVKSRPSLISSKQKLTKRHHYSPVRSDLDSRHHDEEAWESESDEENLTIRGLPSSNSGSKSPTVPRRNFNQSDTSQSPSPSLSALPDVYLLRRQKSKTPPNNQTSQVPITNKSPLIKLLAYICVIALAAILMYMILQNNAKQESSPTPVSSLYISEEELRTTIATVEGNFPEQNPKIWAKVRAAVKPVFKVQEPRQPAVLVIMASNTGKEIASCLAKTLSIKIQGAFKDSSFIHENAEKYSNFNSTEIKHLLDNRINSGFRKGEHVFYLEHLDRVPADSVMIFHGFCDNENAPFKRAVYIMTLIHSNVNNVDENTEVTEVWKYSLAEESRSALESRIGAHKIIIDSAKVNNFVKHCH